MSQKPDYLSQFKSVRNMEVYDYQQSGESAWFEQRLAEYGELVYLYAGNPYILDSIFDHLYSYND